MAWKWAMAIFYEKIGIVVPKTSHPGGNRVDGELQFLHYFDHSTT